MRRKTHRVSFLVFDVFRCSIKKNKISIDQRNQKGKSEKKERIFRRENFFFSFQVEIPIRGAKHAGVVLCYASRSNVDDR